jgi:hypothetical protein
MIFVKQNDYKLVVKIGIFYKGLIIEIKPELKKKV